MVVGSDRGRGRDVSCINYRSRSSAPDGQTGECQIDAGGSVRRGCSGRMEMRAFWAAKEYGRMTMRRGSTVVVVVVYY